MQIYKLNQNLLLIADNNTLQVINTKTNKVATSEVAINLNMRYSQRNNAITVSTNYKPLQRILVHYSDSLVRIV